MGVNNSSDDILKERFVTGISHGIIVNEQTNLNQSNMDLVLHMRISLADIFHDKITKFTTEFDSSGPTPNYNTV
jgi:hypothetical protein